MNKIIAISIGIIVAFFAGAALMNSATPVATVCYEHYGIDKGIEYTELPQSMAIKVCEQIERLIIQMDVVTEDTK